MLKNRVTMLFVFLKWGFRRLPIECVFVANLLYHGVLLLFYVALIVWVFFVLFGLFVFV